MYLAALRLFCCFHKNPAGAQQLDRSLHCISFVLYSTNVKYSTHCLTAKDSHNLLH